MANQLRDYPLVYGSNILETFVENREENPHWSPRKAWKQAQHYHRTFPQRLESINQISQKIPLQVANIFD